MQTYRLILSLIFVCLYLSSCTNDTNSSVIELKNPASTRMGLTDFEDWRYQVDITVNSGTPQTYFIDPNENALSVVITGVRSNEQNSIDILWQAVSNELSVDLSRQSQMFFADGNTIIDAPHTHMEYDFDNDGESNLFELAAGTCLWTTTEPCIHPDLTTTNANNIFLNGDFSQGTDQWWFTGSAAEIVDGELCMNVLPSESQPMQWHVGYLPQFPLEINATYSLSFSARAQNATTMRAALHLREENFEQVFTNDVEVFSSSNRYSYTFDTVEKDYNLTSFVFRLNESEDNVYCFDDLVLEQVID